MLDKPTNSGFRRRAEDVTDSCGIPTAQDAWIRAGLAHKRLYEFDVKIAQIERAFVKNDLGEPGYDEHRVTHIRGVEAEKLMQGYKNEATKKVIGWIVAILLGALGSGAASWLKGHL